MAAAEHRVHLAAPAGYTGPRRALVLPGGGMRLSYQAGAMLALEEAGVVFTHADGTSGGSVNLAMLLSGLSPAEMCDRWSRLGMRDTLSLRSLRDYLDMPGLTSISDGDALLRYAFPHLGVDLSRVRAARGLDAVFNVFNFTRKANESIAAGEMDTAMLLAGMSLPGLLPPLRRGADLYLDSGFVRDANPLEMVRRGASELWVIWALGDIPEYRGGVLDLYVQLLEMSAVGALHEDFDRLCEVNARIEAGERVYGHEQPVRLHLIRPRRPLPLDPDLYAGRVSHAALIDLGYADARRYLASMSEHGVAIEYSATQMESGKRGVTFSEELTGSLALGAMEPAERAGGGARLSLHATVAIPDLKVFLGDPRHAAEVTGHVEFAPLGRISPVYRGAVCFEVRDGRPRAAYELAFDAGGEAYCLTAREGAGGTLDVVLYRGAEASAPIAGAGLLERGFDDLLHTAPTIRVTGPGDTAERARTLATFGRFFLGAAWEAYARPPALWRRAIATGAGVARTAGRLVARLGRRALRERRR